MNVVFNAAWNHHYLYLAMPELLRSAKLAVEKGVAQGRNETYVKQLSDYIVPALVEALLKVTAVPMIDGCFVLIVLAVG